MISFSKVWFVAKQIENLPWLYILNWFHRVLSALYHFQYHLASNARFIAFRSKMPSPPFSFGWQTIAQLAKGILWEVELPCQREFRLIFSIFFTDKPTGMAVSTEFMRTIQPAMDNRFVCFPACESSFDLVNDWVICFLWNFLV